MNITILLHSTTGNTRLVARYAAAHLERCGHRCTVHDIVKASEMPSLDGVDLLGVACPTMYFRGTYAMERFLARFPNATGGGMPAFLLATCAGEPGAHFALQAELLAQKGFAVMGAHWVLAPSNILPSALRGTDALDDVMRKLPGVPRPLRQLYDGVLRPQIRLALALNGMRGLRGIWGSVGSDLGCPDGRDRGALEGFVESMAQLSGLGAMAAPGPRELHKAFPLCGTVGRAFPMELLDQLIGLRIDHDRCSRCGNCVKLCPVKIISRPDDDAVPTFGLGCTGCLACFNRCPEGAIENTFLWAGPEGRGQYRRPPTVMRELFAAR